MKKAYMTPFLQLDTFHTEDIITASQNTLQYINTPAEEQGLVKYDVDKMDLD